MLLKKKLYSAYTLRNLWFTWQLVNFLKGYHLKWRVHQLWTVLRAPKKRWTIARHLWTWILIRSAYLSSTCLQKQKVGLKFRPIISLAQLKDPANFKGKGLEFRAKFIAEREVEDATEETFVEAMRVSKLEVKNSGLHKPRIIVNVSMEGVKIKDSKNLVILLVYFYRSFRWSFTRFPLKS